MTWGPQGNWGQRGTAACPLTSADMLDMSRLGQLDNLNPYDDYLPTLPHPKPPHPTALQPTQRLLLACLCRRVPFGV